MDCQEVKLHLLERNRRPLEPSLEEGVGAHLAGCEVCRRAEAVERTLDELLRDRLPREGAPASLRRRLESTIASPEGAPAVAPRRPARRPGWPSLRVALPTLAAGLAAAIVLVLFLGRGARIEGPVLASLTEEAVSDHLRVLVSEHPLEIESAANHQVKPWFEGRLDFAPVVPSPEVPELRLEGGSIGYFFDRKAAVVEYKLRRHAITLLAFRGEGLPWPRAAEPRLSSARGFQVALWRTGELGYALVSDIPREELAALAATFAAASAH
ncbi:MAG TPA: hypothetical protein VMG32_04190 [Anaeromyxobacteraceae bacterium]|nr:hypothetical protein [Anaeromyxobacteraceae bacterium]